MTQEHDAPLSDDARAMLDAFMAEESPTAAQQDEVWESVSSPAPARRLRKVDTGSQPAATPPPSRTWLWIGAAVAAAAAAVIILGGRVGEQAQRQDDDAPQTAPYQAEPSTAGGNAKKVEPQPVRSMAREVPSPVPPAPPEEVEDTAEPPAAQEPPALQRPSKPRHPPGSDARAEIEALRSAKQALAEGRGEDALRILSGPSTTRGRGQLGREREALRIEALCAVGQADLARKQAKLLLERMPAHPYADKLRQACAD